MARQRLHVEKNKSNSSHSFDNISGSDKDKLVIFEIRGKNAGSTESDINKWTESGY